MRRQMRDDGEPLRYVEDSRLESGVREATRDDGAVSGVRAVDRAVAILQSFTAENPSMSVVELQRRVGLSRPTLYRLLNTLAATGLIQAEGDPQRFRLAHGVMRLAHAWLSGLEALDAARPIVEGLREASGETAALFVRRGAVRVCALEYTSRQVLSISRGVGDTGHITQGASGKAILAFLPEAQRAALLDELPDDARRKHLLESLASARRNGFAISRGEVFAGAVALAAPYYDHGGEVAGSIGLFGPNARLSDDHVATHAKAVVEAARALSVQLGYFARG